MILRRPLARAVAALIGALALAVTLTPPVQAAPPPGTGTPITVMTRNVYLGGDITRPLKPVPGWPAQVPAELQILHQSWLLRQTVDETDFRQRAVLLAREIQQTKPDVVGLQEVATWYSGPFDTDLPTDEDGVVQPMASTLEYDFLALLRNALRRVGVHYDVVHVQRESDVEAPAANVLGGFTNAANHRLVMHDVLLKRSSSRVKVEASGGKQYAAVLPVDIGGKGYEFIRGYNWADISVGAKRLRVINTHLESQLSSFAFWQAQELLATRVLPADRPVVVLCDCNSDPLNATTKPDEPIVGIEHRAPYQLLTTHMDDAWLRTGTTDPGFTSGLNETVDEPPPASFTHRIDLVLTRGLDGSVVPADQPVIVGADPANRTASGLWPSDHAGVVVRLRP
ncbi:MAG: endonuclease/exonuclease/phosphatase family protein [Actinomycetes bacterium]